MSHRTTSQTGGELMTLLTLGPKEKQALAALAAHTTDAHILRRTQALLWLDEGETVPEVAARLGVTPAYKWVACFRMRSTVAMAARLAPAKRSGCPRTVHGRSTP